MRLLRCYASTDRVKEGNWSVGQFRRAVFVGARGRSGLNG
ncbi:hypothetical protein SAMCCGM7_pC1265 (plasmid) [Sinorhizobium americanum CCGM7]|nr:hypothetical protein SAMCCGM7_pC1265 [Sinorhizobium americanum CCGM7]